MFKCDCGRPWKSPAHNKAHKAADNAKQAFTNPDHFRWPTHGGKGLQFQFRSVSEATEYILSLPNAAAEGYRLWRRDLTGHFARGNLEWRPRRIKKKQ